MLNRRHSTRGQLRLFFFACAVFDNADVCTDFYNNFAFSAPFLRKPALLQISSKSKGP